MKKATAMSNIEIFEELEKKTGRSKPELLISLIAYVLGPLDSYGQSLFHTGAAAGEILANTTADEIAARIKDLGIRPTNRVYDLMMNVKL